jgi:hypothetical protein
MLARLSGRPPSLLGKTLRKSAAFVTAWSEPFLNEEPGAARTVWWLTWSPLSSKPHTRFAVEIALLYCQLPNSR